MDGGIIKELEFQNETARSQSVKEEVQNETARSQSWFPKLQTVATAQDEEAKKAAISEVEEGLGVLEGAFQSCSKGKKFFGGERMGFLDIALGCFMAWIRVTETFNRIKFVDEAKVPGLANWAQDFCADDAVKDVMPSTEKLAEFAMKMFTHMKPQS
ncbi:glutathione S-transferase U17-like [Ipomoea triloba]|uniref:glutathione S-transferase U17-like n=1 Tax=Ipomoea triloba TaxID=35885 RepID=UPI00125E397A|nr:glutathione S-transferase U17-like [Ipomoea triloba]